LNVGIPQAAVRAFQPQLHRQKLRRLDGTVRGKRLERQPSLMAAERC